MTKSGIYKIINKKTGKCYVGSACNLKKRLRNHRSSLERNIHHSKKLQRSWNIHGETAFDFLALEQVENKEHLIIREQHWINWFDSYDNGYNATPTAGSRLGSKATDESRKKMSLSHIGKTLPEEQKIKIGKASLGRKMPESAKLKISIALTGKKKSQDHKRKISEAQKGRKLTEEHKAKLRVSRRLYLDKKHGE